MNVRKIKILRRRSWLGRLLRLPFQLIPASAVLSVPFGYLRRKRWIKGSHNLSVVLGMYERRQSQKFYDCAAGRDVFWDLGAHVGYYSLLYHTANPSGRSFGFEPLPKNADFHRRHMLLNGVSDHTLFQVAVSDRAGVLSFDLGRTSVAGKLSGGGTISVDVIRLSDWVDAGKIPPPDLIKMDIEGEEIKVLENIVGILKSKMPVLFLSTHGKQVHDRCVELLYSLNYQLEPLDAPDIGSCRELLARFGSTSFS